MDRVNGRPRLERDGDVYLLHLEPNGENRFHPDWLAAVEAALDEVEAATGPRSLVTTGEGKFWSNGLNLDWVQRNRSEMTSYVDRVHALLARTLASPVFTVAVLTGHTFAAGAMWALAHDVRVMRADRGFVCLPEVDLDLPFTRGMSALIRARLTPATAHEAMTTGRRYGGQEALTAGIVEAVATDPLQAALEIAGALASKSKPVRAKIKQTLYAEALAALRTPSSSDAR